MEGNDAQTSFVDVDVAFRSFPIYLWSDIFQCCCARWPLDVAGRPCGFVVLGHFASIMNNHFSFM